MAISDNTGRFYINGEWVSPSSGASLLDVINPATEASVAKVAIGSPEDAEKAIMAARAAFAGFSATSKDDRLTLLRRIRDVYEARIEEIADAITMEMGAPAGMARSDQAGSGLGHIEATITALESFAFEEQRGTTRIVKEAIGVAGLITPWNWPMNQIACKVAPAIAAGCTVVLKPSEIAPLSGIVFAEIMHEAGVPAGVFNLVNGDGPGVGQVLSSHPEIDIVSFTGSTRAGILVAKSAADTVKRVAQELGGKSPNIILDDAELEAAVKTGVELCFGNSGQSCDSPTRMLVPEGRHEEALAIAKQAAEGLVTGDPLAADTDLGPVISQVQYDKIQALIASGIQDGATLVSGGRDKPDGLNQGYYVKPTVFGAVTHDMRIAREEIFGPVLAIMPYGSEDEAVRIANDTVYGLAAYVQSGDLDHARSIARQMHAGQVHINYPDWDMFAPFGGYKQSGNGREYADWGMHDYLETKALIGHG
ncbi:NAD-dependent aldehyde dehydrogenase [Hoeflea phototrophica DFL-43]|uniref:NAD-dependent aldehyde dehydrogenase n=1 Tax=Hoeflea phototrophica (strain DSM 17068 / NCIMB 14078 / DFL-43) TaxID=411684 RepID=A9D2I2_HOEPD|nr:aldehyde dehydrogenase family protein [Hoeflea phototrophica]EDQ34211.1 NAD-dependent aldehyde dehydrogenase [Hoeflea phototrophica DFL-43]